ncbi:MAG: hypothetical protein QMD85_04565 [Candidatus Aenigmarchaeota archaeon]|nr:hypothetical protein [Candidatus Aenigmarchaeota archaeon]MDI6722838.1 hypothetical protein [Candidatus Aenigmarchaeota archaeon]
MAREVRKGEAKKFIKKSEEFYYSALENYQKARYNASAFDFGLSDNLMERCETLNEVYLEARYGDLGSKLPSEKFDKVTTSEFLELAMEVFKWLKKNI